MAQVIEIHDFSDPALDAFARATDILLVIRADPAIVLFIAESSLVIGRALDAGCVPVSVLMEPQHITGKGAEILGRCDPDLPVYTASLEVLTQLTGFHLTRGMLCAMRRPPLPSVAEVCARARRIAVLENDILRNDESAASLQQEIAAGQQDTAEADAALQRHRAVAKTMEAAGEKLAAEIEALNDELARLADASTASGARKDSLRAELADRTAKRTEAQVAQAAAEAAEETARQRLPALEQAVQEGTDQWETARQDLTDTIRYREMLTENEKQLANVRSGLELKLKNRKAALDEADTAEQRLGRELDAARQRLSVLRELEKNKDGYQNTVRAVMRAAGARRLRGIIGPVSAILKVEPGCEVAVETALGAALQNIVVENEAAATAAIALLRNDNAGRATFLQLDTVQPGVFRGRLSGTARLASSLVQADRRYDNIVSNLLGRIIVVDDINEASRVARDNGFRSKIVTMDGQVINAGGSFTGGSVQRSAGLFTRKQEMEELRVKAAKLQKDCLAAQEKTDRCKEQVDALQAELTATASEQITAANDRVRAEAEQTRLEAAAAQLETAVQNAQQQMDALQAA